VDSESWGIKHDMGHEASPTSINSEQECDHKFSVVCRCSCHLISKALSVTGGILVGVFNSFRLQNHSKHHEHKKIDVFTCIFIHRYTCWEAWVFNMTLK
jgi:hypothetical protein